MTLLMVEHRNWWWWCQNDCYICGYSEWACLSSQYWREWN